MNSTESRTTAAPVPHGTAENLARLAHFRGLTDTLPDAHELDPVLLSLLGPVGNAREVLEHLGDDLDQLWSLLTEDFDDDQVDELTEDDWSRYSFSTYQQELDHRHAATLARLTSEIESAVSVARVIAAEARRTQRVA